MFNKVYKALSSSTVLGGAVKLLCVLLGGILFVSLTGCKEHFNGMLDPKGLIAFQERKLFFDTLALMLIVVIPVIIMSFAFVYHYQISHRTRDYKPNWSHSYLLESIWWAIPCVIILVLAVMTWNKTHELEPSLKLSGYNEKPLVVQVIALPWKWLFIYPEQHVATVNYLEIPVGREVEYQLTTDNVPMSGFFIPQLGSQLYTMAGMRTRLHLVANEVGVYEGLNTQFNGDGFSDMHFEVHVVDPIEMQQWIETVKKSPDSLSDASYETLLIPSDGDKPKLFGNVTSNIFDSVIHTYMGSMGPVHPRENQLKLHKV
ncbi:MAG: ubiquinol oxidase subunit II [Gammaproteobacteria bacterium]|nr:ubiquinol oxidase subunit II [Gammaproteobacteria bacterium]